MTTFHQCNDLVRDVLNYITDTYKSVHQGEVKGKQFEDGDLVVEIERRNSPEAQIKILGTTVSTVSTFLEILKGCEEKTIYVKYGNVEKRKSFDNCAVLKDWIEKELPNASTIGFEFNEGRCYLYQIGSVIYASAFREISQNTDDRTFLILQTIFQFLFLKNESLTHKLITTQDKLSPYFDKNLVKLVLEFIFG